MNNKLIGFLISFALNWPKYKARIIDMLYKTKVSIYPFWLLYLPSPYKVTGQTILRVFGKMQPGDIVLTGTRSWAMQHLIPNKYGYTHAGIYTGNGFIVHAAVGGVRKTNAIDFLQCDRIKVLRISKGAEQAACKARQLVGTPYDYNFRKGQEALYSFQLCAACYPSCGFTCNNIKVFGITLPSFCGSYYYDGSFIDAQCCEEIYG